MPVTDPILWFTIRDWSLPGSSVRRLLRETAVSLTFAQGLAEDYVLLPGNADGVEAEYRRWLYL